MRWPSRVAPFWVQVCAGAAMTTLFILWVRGRWGGEDATVIFSNLASTLAPLGAAFACAYRSHLAEASLRRAWALLAAACASWGLGQAAWTAIEVTTGSTPVVPSAADVGYLGFIPLAAWGVARFVRRDGQPTGYLRPLLDGLIMGSSFIFIVFVLGLERTLLESGRPDLPLIVNLLYPFGDAVIFSLVLSRLSRSDPVARPTLQLLAAGVVFLVVADMWFLVVDAQGLYATGGILDAFWIVGFQLIGLAAMRPTTLARPLEAPRQTTTLVALPLAPFGVAMGAAVAAELRDGAFSDTLFWTAFVVVVLVVLRLLVMLLDNVRLTQRAEAALHAAREEQRLRTQLLNNVTHDLLSPLSPVLLQMKILERPDAGLGEKATHSLQIIRRNLDQVKRLGEDLKDFANLEAGRFRVDHDPVDLAPLALQAAESFQATAQAGGVALSAECPAPLPVLGDRGRLTEVLYNLLSNAIRFTPQGGTVRLRAVAQAAAARLEVVDTGRGLEAAEIALLFRPFSQVHQRSEAKERGTGLGLYVSRSIVEAHGGRIGVVSTGRGHGSTFWAEVPLRPSASPSPAPQAASPGAAGP